MEIAGNSIGVDYHQHTLRVSVMNPLGKELANRVIGNDVGELVGLASRYGEVKRVAIEASTGSAAFVDALKARTGWSVQQCHPGYVRRMKNNPDKSDKSDATLLADLTRVGYLPEVWLAPMRIRQLREVVRYRQQLVNQQRNIKLRLRGTLRQHRLRMSGGSLWTRRGMAWLTEQLSLLPEHSSWIVVRQLEALKAVAAEIKVAEERLSAMTADDREVATLMSQRGVGFVTAVVIRAEVGDFSRFRSGKQLSRFCGMSPRNASSGERVADAGLVKAGNPVLKAALIEVAQGLRRYDPRWREFSASLAAKGKKRNVIVAAVANRWLRKLHHAMMTNEQTLAA